VKRSRERREQTDSAPRGGAWPLLTAIRVGSTTPRGCIVQTLLTGFVTALVFWLALTLA